MSADLPAALQGTFVRLQTMADGTVRLVLDMANSSLADVGALGLAPGVSVVVARMTPVAALQQAQQEAAKPEATGDHGPYYQALYKSGWFNSRDVQAKFGPDQAAIKTSLYELFGVSSMREVEPARFAAEMHAAGLSRTLPTMFKGYLG